jgi:hypothetical protein
MDTITAKQFKEATGRWPIDDDMERANCPIRGYPGHKMCGWCDKCNLPRTMKCKKGCNGAVIKLKKA